MLCGAGRRSRYNQPMRSSPLRRAKWCSIAVGLSLLSLFAPGGVGFASTSRVTSTSRAFTVAVPPGFRNDIAAFSGGAIRLEVFVAGSTENGFAVNINVLRERVHAATVDAVAQASIVALKRISGASDFSTVAHLTVAGAPARALDYRATFGGRLLHDRQVYAVRDGWGYVVTYSALPGSQYQGSLPALSEFLASWRWL